MKKVLIIIFSVLAVVVLAGILLVYRSCGPMPLEKSSLLMADNLYGLMNLSPKRDAVLFQRKGFLYLYTFSDKKEKKLVKLPSQNASETNLQYAISPDLKKFLLVEKDGNNEVPNQFTIYNEAGNILKSQKNNYFSTTSLKWSSQNNIAFIANQDGWQGKTKLFLLDENLKELSSLPIENFESSTETKSLTFSPSGSEIIYFENGNINNPPANVSFDRSNVGANIFYKSDIKDGTLENKILVANIKESRVRGLDINSKNEIIFQNGNDELYMIDKDGKVYKNISWSLSDPNKLNQYNSRYDNSYLIGLLTDNKIAVQRFLWEGGEFGKRSNQLYVNDLSDNWQTI